VLVRCDVVMVPVAWCQWIQDRASCSRPWSQHTPCISHGRQWPI